MKTNYITIKGLIIGVLMLSRLTGYGQQKDNFTLSGVIKNHDFDFIYLRYNAASGALVLDSVKITNGKFQFKGRLAEPTYCCFLIWENEKP